MNLGLAAFLAAFVPALLWLWFFYRRDRYQREPKPMIGRLFLWGMLAAPLAGVVSAVGGVPLEARIQVARTSGPLGPVAGLLLASIALAALIEEAAKYWVTARRVGRDPHFDEPVDGMIYMTTAALGFAALENFLYVGFGRSADPGFLLGVVAPFRAVVSTIGHVTQSGIVGYFLTQRVLGRRSPLVIVTGLLIATVLHTGWNFSLAATTLWPHGSGPVGWLVLAAFTAWATGLILFVVLFRRLLAASPFRPRAVTGSSEARP